MSSPNASKGKKRQEVLLQVITLRQLYKHSSTIHIDAIQAYIAMDPLYKQCESLENGNLLEIIQKLSAQDLEFNEENQEFELKRDLDIVDEKLYPKSFYSAKSSLGRLFALEVYQLAAIAVHIEYRNPSEFFSKMFKKLNIENSKQTLKEEQTTGDENEKIIASKQVLIENQLDELFEIFPIAVSDRIKTICGSRLDKLVEIVMDVKKPLILYFYEEKEKDDSFIIDYEIMDNLCENLMFAQDDRAGINGTLHRISRINSRVSKENKESRVIGLTIRVGRAVVGIGEIFKEITDSKDNILLVGIPNSGKSTLIRDLSRILSEKNRVVIVDTSCEIAGLSDVTHSAVGDSRRIPVREPKNQKTEMLRAVQNHSPEVIVIDEIGAKEEVQTCRTISQRGVRLCASAHGSLESLLVNPILRDLLGGVEEVTVSDERAKLNKGQKVISQMKSTPIFGVIIEVKKLESGETEWVIYKNVKETVRSILNGQSFSGVVRKLLVPNELSTVQDRAVVFEPSAFN